MAQLRSVSSFLKVPLRIYLVSIVQNHLLTTYLLPRSSSSKPESAKDNDPQSNPKGSASSKDPSTSKSAPTSTSTNTSCFGKSVDIALHMGYSIDRFNSDADNSQPAYQYSSSNESILACKARMAAILRDFNAAYHKK